MRKLLLVIPSLFLIAGCQCRQGTTAQVAPLVAEVVDPVFVPVFESTPIPPAIEARMRGVSYPEGADIKLDDLRYLKLSYIDFEGNPVNMNHIDFVKVQCAVNTKSGWLGELSTEVIDVIDFNLVK